MKKFSHFFFLSAAVITLFTASGCAAGFLSFGKKPAQDQASPEVKKAGEDLLKAFVKEDAEGFLKLLPDVVREEFGTAGFKKTRESMKEQLGKPVSYEFVFNLEHPAFTVSIWKVRFERKSSDQKKTIHQETLFRAISGTVDGKEKLLGFNFF